MKVVFNSVILKSKSPSLASPHRTTKKINGFRTLPKGWHRGSGRQIGAGVLEAALEFHALLLSNFFVETDAFPGLSGEIQITAYYGNDCFEFTVEADQKWTFVHQKDSVEIEDVEDLTFEAAKKLISSLWEKIWPTFTSCLFSIGTTEPNPLGASLSSPRPTTAEFQSSRSNVRKALHQRSAFISIPSIPTWSAQTQPDTQLCIGKSQTAYYRQKF